MGAIRYTLQNFTLVLLVVGCVAALIALARVPHTWSRGRIIETVFSYFFLCSIGISYFYNFIVHVFFGEMAARLIGWADSPFQREVGFASLGFAAVGLLAFRGSYSMRVAAIVGPACFMLGAVGGHVLDIMRTGNLAPGNAGTPLSSDILIPLIGFTLLRLQHKSPPEAPCLDS